MQIVTAASVLLWLALHAVLQHRKNSPVAAGTSTGPESPVIANMWTVKRFAGREKTALVLASLAPAVLALWAVPWPAGEDFLLGGWLVFGLVWYWLGAYALRGPSVRPTVTDLEVLSS